MTTHGYEASFGDFGNVLHRTILVHVLKTTELQTFFNVDFYAM